MTDLTPENVRAAADVMETLNKALNLSVETYQYPSSLRSYANLLEREQAVEAKRASLIKELARLMEAAAWGVPEGAPPGSTAIRVATAIVDRYPSLLDEPKEQK